MEKLSFKKIPKKLEKEADKTMNKLESEYPLPISNEVGFKMVYKKKDDNFAENLVNELEKEK